MPTRANVALMMALKKLVIDTPNQKRPEMEYTS
jgi:hypothetical protein